MNIAGLRLRLRLDRIDQVQLINPDNDPDDDSFAHKPSALILDYKSSPVGPSAWSGDRPDDIQLPLYATAAPARAA